jgi:hypothetical protein
MLVRALRKGMKKEEEEKKEQNDDRDKKQLGNLGSRINVE